ncbi:phosphotransferase enzyme family protein [Histoplasma capsulatum H143]|uniref:Phosphotransferase enzyme family protein n=1 Tax=Ajellomyces capsulatus (strain H143) TaxID=544712 RepID=C6H1W9_AJECH|nr:phosphotransferase enzyme family protein [Histoplasma capsulatum H143]
MSATDYAVASAKREMTCISKFSPFPRLQGKYYGTSQYHRCAQMKPSAINNYLKIATCLLPKNRYRSRTPALLNFDEAASRIP